MWKFATDREIIQQLIGVVAAFLGHNLSGFAAVLGVHELCGERLFRKLSCIPRARIQKLWDGLLQEVGGYSQLFVL